MTGSGRVRFVWVKGLRGPAPELWYGEHVDMMGKERPALFKVDLPPEQRGLSHAELARIYPPPKEPE